MSTSLTSISFGINEKAARAVQKHPRLVRLLPAAIDELVTGLHGAEALAASVKAVQVETVDFQALLDADLRSGKTPDALKLIDDFAAADRKASEVRAVAEHLAALPVYYVNEIVHVINDEIPTMPDVLAEELDELLDRAEPVVAQLDGIDSADAANDAEKDAEWRQLKTLAAEYADLRAAQIDLARLEDPLNLTPNSVGVALVTLGGIENVVPDLARRLAGQVINAITGSAITDLPFPLFSFRDPEHLLALVRHRAVLKPHVARPAEIAERRTALHEASESAGAQPESRRLAQEYGGELNAARHSGVARRARNQGPVITPKVPQPFDGVGFGHRR